MSIVDRIKDMNEFQLVWRIPFEKESQLAMNFVTDHLDDILNGDCWWAGTRNDTFFSLYNIDDDEYLKERKKRDNILNNDLLFSKDETVYIIMGGNPFRYVTIEYSENLGILTDYQLATRDRR